MVSVSGRSAAHTAKSVKTRDTPTNQGNPKAATGRKTNISASANREKCADLKPLGSKGRGAATRPTTLTPGGLCKAKKVTVTNKGD